MIVVTCEQGTQEWLEARAGACTASRFSRARERTGGLTDQQAAYVAAIRRGASEAAAMAEAGYKAKPTSKSIDKVLAGGRVDMPSVPARRYAWLLAQERIAGQPLDETFQTFAMRRGQELEPRAREAYEARFGVMVEPAGILLTDDRLYGYSTDGQVFGQNGGVEIKCPIDADKLGSAWEAPETAEAEYLDQMDGGIWLTGWDWIDLVIYCPWLESVGKDLFVKRIWRDDDRIEALEADLVEFTAMSQRFEQLLRDRSIPARYERLPARHQPKQGVAPWVADPSDIDAPAPAPAPTTAVAPGALPADIFA